jgi:hypothetical protein
MKWQGSAAAAAESHQMKFLVASLIGAAMLLPACSLAAEEDIPPSAAPSAPQSTLQTGTHAPSKLEARFTTQWSGGSRTAQTSAESAPRVAPRVPREANE